MAMEGGARPARGRGRQHGDEEEEVELAVVGRGEGAGDGRRRSGERVARPGELGADGGLGRSMVRDEEGKDVGGKEIGIQKRGERKKRIREEKETQGPERKIRDLFARWKGLFAKRRKDRRVAARCRG